MQTLDTTLGETNDDATAAAPVSSHGGPPPVVREHTGLGAALAAVGVVLVAHVLLWIRMTQLPMPMHGTDETTYWANARLLFSQPPASALHPFSFNVNNYLYLFILRCLEPLGPDAFWVRLVNYLAIAGSAALVVQLARSVRAEAYAPLCGALTCALAFTALGVAAMPEMVFMWFYILAAYLFVRRSSTPRLLHALAVGTALGALVMTKAHGVAVLCGTVASYLVLPLLSGRTFHDFGKAATSALATVAVAYITVVVIAASATGTLTFSPFIFVGRTYSSIIVNPSGTVDRVSAAFDISRYLVAHVLAVITLFGPAVFSGAAIFLKAAGARPAVTAPADPLIRLTVFTVCTTAALFGMTAVFTHKVGTALEFEANRVHLRYWSCALPLWLILSAAAPRLEAAGVFRQERLVAAAKAVLWLCGIAGFVQLTGTTFKLYPWDAPDLFGFYRGTIPTWPFAPTVTWSVYAAAGALALAAVASAFRLRHRAGVHLAAVTAVVLLGSINTLSWQRDHARTITPLHDEAVAIARGLAPGSRGVLLTGDLWGRAPYVLFHLPPHTRIVASLAEAGFTNAARSEGAADQPAVNWPDGVTWLVVAHPAAAPGLSAPHMTGPLLTLHRR